MKESADLNFPLLRRSVLHRSGLRSIDILLSREPHLRFNDSPVNSFPRRVVRTEMITGTAFWVVPRRPVLVVSSNARHSDLKSSCSFTSVVAPIVCWSEVGSSVPRAARPELPASHPEEIGTHHSRIVPFGSR